ncbi:MAG TPA: 4-(cytidine 5'-diphospho)-2-C-methyl-D-erythritol kinase [Chitinophagaceae bacterium]|nr:4-(cytidine 5'-diphospho)-2-C-methyl-D-erythritol kinase [Chitinophagaceae bacterium]
MIVFPNCKINLGLRLLRKRSDGFHDLETVFSPLPIKDALEAVTAANDTQPSIYDIQFSSSGLKIEGLEEKNLCIKAFQLLKKKFPSLPSIKMHLHKTIPIGAGLGGGSSDGAFTLKLLNKKYDLGLSNQELIDTALQLGSDCPFFIINQPCFATGRGEILETINLDLTAYKFVLVKPGIHISTSWAFSQVKPALPGKSIREIIQQPIKKWKDELVNDFEEAVFVVHPEIKQIKDQLYQAGAIFAAMSGSGSTVYGIFKTEEKPNLVFPSHYFFCESTGQSKQFF